MTAAENELVQAVQLYATEPGDPLIFSEVPQWLNEALVGSVIKPVPGDSVDGSDWVYIYHTDSNEICRTGDWIVRDLKGGLYFEKTSEILNQYERVGDSPIMYRKRSDISKGTEH